MSRRELALSTKQELQVKKEYVKAVWFILRADETRDENICLDLKSLAYRGRDKYFTTLAAV